MDRRTFVAGAVIGALGATAAKATGQAIGERLGDPDERGQLSFSEQGEDIVLAHAVRDLMKTERPTYMDVGAALPVRGSNTYLLYYMGGQGVLVEPNPTFAQLLRDRRPRDQVVEAGIGVAEATAAEYFVIKGNPMLNTFSRERVEYLQRGQAETVVDHVVTMPLLTLNSVIGRRLGRAPDVLSTDVEGLDLDILRTLDWTQFRPGAICVETTWMGVHGEHSEISAYLVSHGYVPRGGSLVNTVFVDGTRWS